MKRFAVFAASLIIASVVFGQSQDKNAQIAAKPDLSAKAEVAKPDVVPVNDTVACTIDRQSLKIENASLRKQNADLLSQLSAIEQRAAQTDGNTAVDEAYRAAGLSRTDYDFTMDQRTGHYSFVKRKP